jgi:purine-binding chemotaxis protein CheW
MMSETSSTTQIVVFSLGEEAYALPIGSVHEIILWTQPRQVASDDPSVRGVISLRGRIVPVFDLATRLGVSSQLSETSKILIVASDDSMAGVVVDDVEDVFTVDRAEFSKGGTHVCGACVDGVAEIEGRLIVLLVHERIVAVGTGWQQDLEAAESVEQTPVTLDAHAA